MTTTPERKRLDVQADVLERAHRHNDDELNDIRKSGDHTNLERELAACLLAARQLADETGDVLEARDGELDRLEESIRGMIKRIERHGAGAGGAVLKIAPATRFAPRSIGAADELVEVAVEVMVERDDVAPALAAFLDGALWVCAVAPAGGES